MTNEPWGFDEYPIDMPVIITPHKTPEEEDDENTRAEVDTALEYGSMDT